MVCQSCNATNAETHKYCADCGVKLEVPAPAPAVAPQEPAEVYTALDRGDTEAALAAALKALADDPESVSAHLALATVYERRGEHEEAALQRRLVVNATTTEFSPADTEVAPLPLVAVTRHRWLMAAGAAVCCGLVVVGIGVGQMLAASQRAATPPSTSNSAGDTSQLVLAPQDAAGSSGGTASVVGSTTPVRPTVPTALPPRTPRAGNAVVAQPFQQRFATGATFPEPIRRVGLPQVVDHAPTKPQEPLTAAAVGDVTPIAITPPKQTTPATGTTLPVTGGVTGPRTEPTGVANGATSETPEKSSGNTELSNGEGGFIRIERNGGAARDRKPETAPTGAPTAQSERNSTTPAPEVPRPQPALMGQARREERLGSAALNDGLALEAQQHFTAAYRLYATVVAQGGPEAREARARAQYCRQALSTLR